jgi:hypothetical protein
VAGIGINSDGSLEVYTDGFHGLKNSLSSVAARGSESSGNIGLLGNNLAGENRGENFSSAGERAAGCAFCGDGKLIKLFEVGCWNGALGKRGIHFVTLSLEFMLLGRGLKVLELGSVLGVD